MTLSKAKERRSYPQEFKLEAVRLSRQPGLTVTKAAADWGLPVNLLHRWRREVTEDGPDAFRGHGRLRADQEELAQWRRENAELRLEREILKKAAADFARHPRCDSAGMELLQNL